MRRRYFKWLPSHHERWDGSGYPNALAGESIHEAARIVALADVFDAFTMKRPYKATWPLDQTMAVMQESSGSHFEPRLVERFVAILPQILSLQTVRNERERTQQAAD